ncbi:hypothetical protein, partial [Alkalimonas amylolytica]|uniref:hypothetical protein n=1 Tax=Alkalimonas amylolytica TaxID=152573 RepID=UPI001C0B8019
VSTQVPTQIIDCELLKSSASFRSRTRILHRPSSKSSRFRKYFSKPLHFTSLFEGFTAICKRGRHFRDLKRAAKADNQLFRHFSIPLQGSVICTISRANRALLAWVGIIGSF